MASLTREPDDLADTITVKSILERIAKEKDWSKEDVTNDLSILARNRIIHVHDLRALSNESWTQIELLPLVKDLLRSAIDSSWPTSNNRRSDEIPSNDSDSDDTKKKKNKKKKSESFDEDETEKRKKKDKKKKAFVSTSSLGTPVEPAILTDQQFLSVSNGYLHDNSSDTSLISQDPITIENTIRNANVGSTSEEDNEDEDDDDAEESDPVEDSVPTTPTRRKSVSFSEETSIINSNDPSAKKEKKKDKKNKKKKKALASITNDSFYSSAHPYTRRPIVNLQRQPSKENQSLPPAPPDDSFLQSIHDKLVSSSPTIDV